MTNNGDKKDNKTCKLAIGLAVIPLIMALVSITVYVSITAICVSAFSDAKGYTVYSFNEETEQWKKEYTYMYEDGEDTRIDEFKDVETQKEYIRVLGPTAKVLLKTFVQVLVLIVMCLTLYYHMAPKGETDRNKTDFGNCQGDRLLGFRAGGIAAIPYVAIYILLVAERFGSTKFAYSVFKTVNFTYFYLFELFTNNALKTSDIPVWSFPLLLIIVAIMPVVGGTAYYLGYKHIYIGKILVYGKKKEGKN